MFFNYISKKQYIFIIKIFYIISTIFNFSIVSFNLSIAETYLLFVLAHGFSNFGCFSILKVSTSWPFVAHNRQRLKVDWVNALTLFYYIAPVFQVEGQNWKLNILEIHWTIKIQFWLPYFVFYFYIWASGELMIKSMIIETSRNLIDLIFKYTNFN